MKIIDNGEVVLIYPFLFEDEEVNDTELYVRGQRRPRRIEVYPQRPCDHQGAFLMMTPDRCKQLEEALRIVRTRIGGNRE